MINSYYESQVLDVESIDTRHYEAFFGEPKNCSELNISIDEDAFSRTPYSGLITNEKSTKDINNLASIYSSIELKRKKNREASKISRKKKKDDIISLVKANEQLKAKIIELDQQIKNNICSQCKTKLSAPLAISSNIKEKQHKEARLSTTSSFNVSPIRAKTAMFISMVVIFCVIVNSVSDGGKNYLRKVSMKHRINDYFDSIEFISEDPHDITKCLDFFQYHYSMKKGYDVDTSISISQERNSQLTGCKTFNIDLDSQNESNNNSTSIKLNINVNKYHLISQIFKEDNIPQENSSHLNLIQLECIDIHFNKSIIT